jgi:hypothetical protein
VKVTEFVFSLPGISGPVKYVPSHEQCMATWQKMNGREGNLSFTLLQTQLWSDMQGVLSQSKSQHKSTKKCTLVRNMHKWSSKRKHDETCYWLDEIPDSHSGMKTAVF